MPTSTKLFILEKSIKSTLGIQIIPNIDVIKAAISINADIIEHHVCFDKKCNLS